MAMRDDHSPVSAPPLVPRVVECHGYLADETVFNLVRQGVEAAVRKHRITAPVYVCHSLGCFIGLHAASREIGAHVIAINMPATPWHGFRHAFHVAARTVAVGLKRGWQEAGLYRDSRIYFGSHSINTLSQQRLHHARTQANRYTRPRRRDVALFLKSVLLEHRPKGPHAPRVMLLHGELDPLAPERDMPRFQKRLPRSYFVTVDGAHVLPVTHPDDVIRAIDEFLADARSFAGASQYR